jgi:hypothetical protein
MDRTEYDLLMTHRRRFPFVILLLLAAGSLGACGHPAERKLQGRWQGERIETNDPAELSAVTGWVKGTSFLFKGEQLIVEIPAESPRSGKFEVLAYREGKVTVGVHRQDGMVDKVDLILDDERLLRWQLSGGRAIWMRRSP